MTDATLDTSMTTGTITGRPAVRLERYLPDPPPVVWQAITDRAQLKAWFPCDVIVEDGRWEVGAAITFPFPPEVIEMTLTGTSDEGAYPDADQRAGRLVAVHGTLGRLFSRELSISAGPSDVGV